MHAHKEHSLVHGKTVQYGWDILLGIIEQHLWGITEATLLALLARGTITAVVQTQSSIVPALFPVPQKKRLKRWARTFLMSQLPFCHPQRQQAGGPLCAAA